MNTALSFAATSPDWARPASPPSRLALSMNWRSEPCPLLLVFTTALKLNPKSRPVMFAAETTTGVTDCAVPLRTAEYTKVVVLKVAPAEPLPGSATDGLVPPT